jgi:hypothetical protein
MRRVSFVLVVYYMQELPYFTLLILMVLQVAWMGYNHTVQPLNHVCDRAHKLEVLTDWTILFTIYSVLTFTNLISDYRTRYGIGWLLLIIQGATISISLGFVIYDGINELIRMYRKRK